MPDPGWAIVRADDVEEPVEIWAVSVKEHDRDATQIDNFWAASPDAKQTR